MALCGDGFTFGAREWVLYPDTAVICIRFASGQLAPGYASQHPSFCALRSIH